MRGSSAGKQSYRLDGVDCMGVGHIVTWVKQGSRGTGILISFDVNISCVFIHPFLSSQAARAPEPDTR